MAGTHKLQWENRASSEIAAKTIVTRTQNFPLLHFAIVRRQLRRVTLFKLNSTLFLHKIDDHNSQWHFLREMLLEKLQSEAGLNSCICWTGSLQLHRTQDKWQVILLTHSSITSKSSYSYFILQRRIIFLIELPGEKKNNFTKDDKIKGTTLCHRYEWKKKNHLILSLGLKKYFQVFYLYQHVTSGRDNYRPQVS